MSKCIKVQDSKEVKLARPGILGLFGLKRTVYTPEIWEYTGEEQETKGELKKQDIEKSKEEMAIVHSRQEEIFFNTLFWGFLIGYALYVLWSVYQAVT